MASAALGSLFVAMEEVGDLERANPSPSGAAPVEPDLTRVIGRASVVLLSSHFERYFYRVNEEASDALNAAGVPGDRYPENLRLLHSKDVVDSVAGTEWTQRADKLRLLAREEVWLWLDAGAGAIDHSRLLSWMTSPKPANLVRYYKYWGITDIFSAITRKASTRSDLWLRIHSLVEKRNNIAHGDMSEQATQRDVRFFKQGVRTFCERADKKLTAQLANVFDIPSPW